MEKNSPRYENLSVSREGYLDLQKDGFHYDMIDGLLSPSTRNIDLRVKSDRYLNCGVKEYWIIDPKEKTISVWRNENLS
jgi:Uma2 family endonuclease